MPGADLNKTLMRRVIEPLGTLRRVLPLLWASSPKWAVLTAVLMVLEIAFGLLSLYLIKKLVDALTSAMSVEAANGDLSSVMLVVAATGVASLGYLSFRGLATLAREAQGMHVADYMDRMIHERAVTADLAFYESPRYFDTLQRARQSGSQRPAQVVSNLMLMLKNLVMLAAIVALIVTINSLLLPLLVLAILPALFVRLHFTRILYEWRRRRTQLERRASYFDWLMTSNVNAKEVQLNQLGQYLRDAYSNIRGIIRGENFRINRRRTLVELLVGVFATAAFFGALAWLTRETAEGRNSLGDLVLFLIIFQRAQSMGQELINQISRFYEDHLYIGLLFEFLNIRPGIRSASDPAELPGRDAPLTVTLEGVNFRYPGCEDDALKDVSMEIGQGQVVALVSANGSGKTSLIKILSRLYDPDSGAVRVNGRDAREFELEEYRRLFSVIFQDYGKYADTVRENIRYGDIRLEEDSPALVDASRRAGAHEFVKNLKRGYDTRLSRMFDDGQEISIGQWQKIALARAFLMRSRVLILDEPTSALDPNAEYELFENFRERIQGRSALVISHRLSTIRMADYIYVMHEGRVVEQGTHDELITARGFYFDSFSKQGRYYRDERLTPLASTSDGRESR
ncbi:MAG: ABC transporter ATP-binding protein/permease [Wenzhouxiangella sp.]|nr:ABC transporter ATP-binding protein/permease [Wenzhouxiangella sp.]